MTPSCWGSMRPNCVIFLMGMGRHTEALEEMKRAQELDPLSPAIATFIGKAYYYAGNNEEAIRQYRKVLDSDPSFPMAQLLDQFS